MDEYNLTSAVIAQIETRKGELTPPNSAYEAYGELLHEAERATAAAERLPKLMKELWSGVKQNDDTTVAAYEREIESVCRSTAAAYANMAAVAGLASDS